MHTLGLPTTAVLGSVFRGADLDSQIAWSSRSAAASVANAGSLLSVREAIQKGTVDCLLSYRKNCATASSPGQLILPESLRLLPLYSNALMKCPAFWCAAPLPSCSPPRLLRHWLHPSLCFPSPPSRTLPRNVFTKSSFEQTCDLGHRRPMLLCGIPHRLVRGRVS